MQLTQFTDYSLRAIIYIAIKDTPSTISEIASAYNISRNHVVKIIHKLGQLGYIKTIRGNKGGVTLNKNPKDINIGELVQLTEPNFNLVECLNKGNGTCCIIPVCKLKGVLETAKNNFLNLLSQYTLLDLIENKSELATYLKITN